MDFIGALPGLPRPPFNREYILGSKLEWLRGWDCRAGLLDGGLGAGAGGGGSAAGGEEGGGGGALDVEDLCVPNASRAACMATEFYNPNEGLDGAGAGAGAEGGGGGGGGVDREGGINGAKLGGWWKC